MYLNKSDKISPRKVKSHSEGILNIQFNLQTMYFVVLRLSPHAIYGYNICRYTQKLNVKF